jgi:hypothetical protein
LHAPAGRFDCGKIKKSAHGKNRIIKQGIQAEIGRGIAQTYINANFELCGLKGV